jgi:hypothetical protein
MNATTAHVRHLMAAFATTFVALSALAMLVGQVWFDLTPVSRIDRWAFGLLISTAIASVLVFFGSFLGSRQRANTVSAARWAGIIVAIPLVAGFELVEYWSTFIGPAPWFIFTAMAMCSVVGPWFLMRGNSALLTDAYSSPRGAAKRGRRVA